MPTVPVPAPDVLVYTHPQGKTIHVHPNGSMDVFKPDGKRSTSSATPAKLAAGHGGWTLASGTAPAGPIPELTGAAPAVSPVTAMTYVEVDFAEVPAMLMDDTIAAEQKLDGTRTVVLVKDGMVAFFGRNGQPLKHAAAAAHFAALRPAFESLGRRARARRRAHLGDRRALALRRAAVDGRPRDQAVRPALRVGAPTSSSSDVVLNRHNPKIKVVPAGDRRRREGHGSSRPCTRPAARASCSSGSRRPTTAASGVKHSVKAKFVKTADVIVLERDVNGKKNAMLGVWDPVGRAFDEVGACSMIGKDDAKVGDVVEVAYLNWTGTKLYQPRFLKVRTDKGQIDCLMDQFPAYSKGVLA